MQELGAWPHGSLFVDANLVMAKEKAAMPQVAGEMRKQWSEMKQHNTNTRFIELAKSMERISALVNDGINNDDQRFDNGRCFLKLLPCHEALADGQWPRLT